jgi:hypothetical protein
MKMEYTAEVLRGWPADGARERQELIKQGSVLVNGDIVEMQVDGTVDKTSATANKRVGLVIRGNGDSGAGANANGILVTPQPAKTITAMTWSGGVVTATLAGHGYLTGNIVTIAGVTPAGYNGAYVITVTGTGTFTYALASNPGASTVQGTATQTSTRSGSGKALVLWGNYIVKVSNYTAGAYVPGSPVTAVSGKFSLANGTTDPEVGYVVRVQGVTGTETAALTIVAF